VPASFCGFKLRVTFPANKEYTKILKTADGSKTFLFTGAVTASFTNLQTGQTITEKMNGPGKATIHADGSITEVHTGRNGPFILAPADAKRFGLPPVSVTAGKLAFSVSAPPPDHHLAEPAWPRPGERVRRAKLAGRIPHESAHSRQ
jgi:hypothetical protein